MTNKAEFSIFITVGKTGNEDEAKTEQFTITWDPSMSEDENVAVLNLRAQIMQIRLQAHITEIMANAGPEFIKALSGTGD